MFTQGRTQRRRIGNSTLLASASPAESAVTPSDPKGKTHMSMSLAGAVHHIELWVPDIDRAATEWGWLLGELGYEPYEEWPGGRSWRLGPTYLVIEQSPDMTSSDHERTRAGLNHLAFHAGRHAWLDELVERAPARGWRQLFAEQYPHAGGPDTYAAYLVNTDGYEVELVAEPDA